MQTPVILTKLLPPRADSGFIDRPRLLGPLLGREDWKVAFVTAPAGFGKTVFMSQAAREFGVPAVWYQLDALDNDPVAFLEYLMTGIQAYVPDFGNAGKRATLDYGLSPGYRVLSSAFINELTGLKTPLTLVLDDYHVLTEPAVHQFTHDLICYLPPGIRLLIASRTALPTSTEKLVVSGLAVSVKAGDLRFTGEEVAALFGLHATNVNNATLSDVERRTGGWPVALRLLEGSARSLPGIDEDSGHRRLYDYLAAEVLTQQPGDVQDFLLGTSVLETMTPELCDALLGRVDSERVLRDLEKQHLLVVPLAGDLCAYRYHQLFRDFLLDRLGVEHQRRFRSRAGKAAFGLGLVKDAIEHYVMAAEHDELASLVRLEGGPALRRGRWQTVARWLESLPAAFIARDPWLGLFRAEVAAYQGRLDGAEERATRAQTLFMEQNDDLGLAESKVLLARVMRGRGCLEQSAALLDEAYPVLERQPGKRFDIPIEQSLTIMMMGRIDEAERILTQALRAAEPQGDPDVIARLAETLGNIHYTQGRYEKALQAFGRASELSPERVLPNYYMQDSIAVIYWTWGELDRALEQVRTSLASRQASGAVETLPSALVQIGTIYTDLGDYALAEENFRRAIATIKENAGELFYLSLNYVFLARCLVRQGRWADALDMIEQGLAIAGRQGGLALAACQQVAAMSLLMMGHIGDGKRLLGEAITGLERIGFKMPLCEAYGAMAWLLEEDEKRDQAHLYAAKCLELAATMNAVQTFVCLREQAWPVLRMAIEDGVALPFVQRVLARMGTSGLGLLSELAGHSDPAVRRRVVAPLHEVGLTGGKGVLLQLLSDPDRDVRELAQAAILRLGTAETGASDISLSGQSVLYLQGLGSFRVFANGAELEPNCWRISKARALLAYLAYRGEAVAKGRLLDELWPDTERDRANALFHTTLYHLRETLARACCSRELVVYSNGRYQMAPGCFSADWQQFERLALSGPGRAPSSLPADVLEKVTALYRGDFLEDLDYPWVTSARERLAQLHTESRERLGRLYLEQREFARAIRHLQTLVQSNPLSEEIYCLLMTAYAGLGDRMAVKRHYETLVRLLDEELGLAPAHQTRDLYYRLCGQQRPAR